MPYVLLTERVGSGLPIRPGEFDSHRALSRSLVAHKYGCGLMVSQLPLKQLIEGSNPSARAVAVLYWFQELGCELSPCRFDSDRSPCGCSKQSCGLAAKAPALQAVDRRYESVQDYFIRAMLLRLSIVLQPFLEVVFKASQNKKQPKLRTGMGKKDGSSGVSGRSTKRTLDRK